MAAGYDADFVGSYLIVLGSRPTVEGLKKIYVEPVKRPRILRGRGVRQCHQYRQWGGGSGDRCGPCGCVIDAPLRSRVSELADSRNEQIDAHHPRQQPHYQTLAIGRPCIQPIDPFARRDRRPYEAHY